MRVYWVYQNSAWSGPTRTQTDRASQDVPGCTDPTFSLDLEVLVSLRFHFFVASLGTKAALSCLLTRALCLAGGVGPVTLCPSVNLGVETQPQGRGCGTWP